jgi:hypothetical protein
MDLQQILAGTAKLAADLTPSMIGAATAQAWKPGVPFRQRLLQWIVGSTVSYYATLAIIAVTGWSDFVAQSIAFSIALLAFDATPRILKSVVDALASAPQRLADKFLPRKED